MSLTGLREMVVLARGNVGDAVVVVCVFGVVLPKKSCVLWVSVRLGNLSFRL